MPLGDDIKMQFPLLADRPVIYLDSAASSQKPLHVLDAMEHFYRTFNANVHRGAYEIAALATEAAEGARRAVAGFIGANSPAEVIFTKNATEAMNLVARSWGGANLGPHDAVVVTEMEHHSNIVPWQIMSDITGCELRWISVDDRGHLDTSDLDRLLDGAKMLAVTAMSNVLGTLTPVAELAAAAHRAGALVLVDASQRVPHVPTDVNELDADFMAFTGHKMCGPTGVGVLWGREQLLDAMPPFLGGGEMILDVRKDGFTPNELPHKFEAGTPPIAEIIGLGAAVEFLSELGMDAIRTHEVQLTSYALRTLTERFGERIRIHGPTEPAERGGVLSFAYGDIHPHDLSQVLDARGVCVRAGHHCAKPLMAALGEPATARASVYLYNSPADIDELAEGLVDADALFGTGSRAGSGTGR